MPIAYVVERDFVITTHLLESYVSSLPPPARLHLELQLDWGHKGVDKDLNEIADHMMDWEEKLSTHLELTHTDIHDVKAIHKDNPVLQR